MGLFKKVILEVVSAYCDFFLKKNMHHSNLTPENIIIQPNNSNLEIKFRDFV